MNCWSEKDKIKPIDTLPSYLITFIGIFVLYCTEHAFHLNRTKPVNQIQAVCCQNVIVITCEWEKSNLFDCDWLAYEEDLQFIVLILVLIPQELRRSGQVPTGEFLTQWNLITPSLQSNHLWIVIIIDIHNRK